MSLEVEGRFTDFSVLVGDLTAFLTAFLTSSLTSTFDTWTTGFFTVALRVRLLRGAVATVISLIKTSD